MQFHALSGGALQLTVYSLHQVSQKKIPSFKTKPQQPRWPGMQQADLATGASLSPVLNQKQRGLSQPTIPANSAPLILIH